MTLPDFLPWAPGFWKIVNTDEVSAFLNRWQEQPQQAREAFVAFLRALRGCLELYHAVTPTMLDDLGDPRNRVFIQTLSSDIFTDFSGQRYTLAMQLARQQDPPTLTELLLRLRPPSRAGLREIFEEGQPGGRYT